MLGEARPAVNIPSLKIIFMMKPNILLITSVILLLHHITIASATAAFDEQQRRQFQLQVGEGDLTRTSSPARYYHQDQEQDEEDVDFEYHTDDEEPLQKPNMPAIIVSEAQESSQPFSTDEAGKLHHHHSDEPLEARESRNNIFGIGISPSSNDNGDDYEDNNHVAEDELSTSYNNILLSPFAPYPLINQQRQHLRNVLFRRVAPIQNAYQDEDRNAAQQPVNLIYVPASTLNQPTHHQQPSVVLQELRSLQYHDKSPLVIFHPLNIPLQTNSVSWPSKYQADKYLPPDETFSRLFTRSSQPAHAQNPLDAFFRRFEIPPQYEHQQQNNFIGNQPFYQNSNLYHHRYSPQVPFFSSNVPIISNNFPLQLPYVSPSLRGYKSQTTTPPSSAAGDIDVRMSTVDDDEFSRQQPTQTQIDQPNNGLLNRAAATESERDIEEITTTVEPRRNSEGNSESPIKYEESSTTATTTAAEIVNGENQQEESGDDDEKLNVEGSSSGGVLLRSALESEPSSTDEPAETMTTTTSPAVTLLPPAQSSDENSIDSTESTTTITSTDSSIDEMMTTTTTTNDEMMMTTTEIPTS